MKLEELPIERLRLKLMVTTMAYFMAVSLEVKEELHKEAEQIMQLIQKKEGEQTNGKRMA